MRQESKTIQQSHSSPYPLQRGTKTLLKNIKAFLGCFLNLGPKMTFLKTLRAALPNNPEYMYL
jgi:hypothetical protein